MTLNELPDENKVGQYKLRIPEDVLREFRDISGGHPEMYFVGGVMGGMMFSPSPPTASRRRLYPAPESLTFRDICGWEIVENEEEKV